MTDAVYIDEVELIRRMSAMGNAISDFGAATVTLLLAAGVALVGTTKILCAGCGVEIREIGCRVVSGNTMLLSAVWTICIALFWLCRSKTGGTSKYYMIRVTYEKSE